MATYEQQTFLSLEEELISCRQECRVSLRVLPGGGEARKMTVGSGRQCSMLLSESSLLGRFSRILLGSSHWGSSMEYCYVWERLDTRFALSAFRLTPLGQSTGDSGCLLWPTPDAGNFNSGENPETYLERRRKLVQEGKCQGMGMNLAIAAKLLPTRRNDHSGL